MTITPGTFRPPGVIVVIWPFFPDFWCSWCYNGHFANEFSESLVLAVILPKTRKFFKKDRVVLAIWVPGVITSFFWDELSYFTVFRPVSRLKYISGAPLRRSFDFNARTRSRIASKPCSVNPLWKTALHNWSRQNLYIKFSLLHTLIFLLYIKFSLLHIQFCRDQFNGEPNG